MLNKYLELLRNGIEAITGLGIKDATFLDYITAVGYEFAIVLLGLLGLVICAAMVAGPFVLIWRIKKKMYVKVHQKDEIFKQLDLMPTFYGNVSNQFTNCAAASCGFESWVRGQSKKLDIPGMEEIYKVLQKMGKLSNGWDKISTEDYTSCREEIQKIIKENDLLQKRYAARDDAIRYEEKVRRILWGVSAGIIFVWLMFLIPFVLMFI